MAEQKTQPTKVSVDKFLEEVEPEEKRRDSYEILTIMREITGEEPVMWGPSIVGFGKYHYKYASGHEGDACITGFSPRKQAITIYAMLGLINNEEMLAKLGKYKKGVGCLYIKRLAEVDRDLLKDIIKHSVSEIRKTYQQ